MKFGLWLIWLAVPFSAAQAQEARSGPAPQGTALAVPVAGTAPAGVPVNVSSVPLVLPAPVAHAPIAVPVAVQPPLAFPPHQELPAPKSIRDTPIYVYSFLDFREAEFTRKVLDTISSDLTERLKAANCASQILEFRKTPQGEFLSDAFAVGTSSTPIPVRAVITGNAAQEAASGAKLRLLIFPARYDVAGAWRFYSIRWMLYVPGNNRPFLDYTYSGKHLVMWSNSENASARSKKILDAVFDDSKANGLI